jgi:hypothetical protein
VDNQFVLPTASGRSLRQRSLRRRVSPLSLADGVRLAVGALFRFRYCGVRTGALWSEAEHVWLGRETFLHWAIWDSDIDIPWVVAATADAPGDEDELLAAVRVELISYWTTSLERLPEKKSPTWLPLP